MLFKVGLLLPSMLVVAYVGAEPAPIKSVVGSIYAKEELNSTVKGTAPLVLSALAFASAYPPVWEQRRQVPIGLPHQASRHTHRRSGIPVGW